MREVEAQLQLHRHRLGVVLHELGELVVRVGLGVLCFYFCAIMLLTIMLSEFTILERDYATYMLA